jgi:hypothetical protein
MDDLELSRELSVIDGMFATHFPLIAFQEIFKVLAKLIPKSQFVLPRIFAEID